MDYPHIVEVDLLGMTGIIVDRLLCKDVLADPSSSLHGASPPSPPQDMKVIAVVHQSASGCDPGLPTAARYGVSAVSSPLQRSAGKEGIAGRVSGKQRYLALWNSGGLNGDRPSMVFETDLPRKRATKGVDEDKFSTSKKFDLHLLMQDTGTNATIPVGRALLTLRPGLIGEHNLVVHPIQYNDADLPGESIGSKPVYSVDPSARLRVLISVTERDGNPVSRSSSDSGSSIPRVASKPVDSIEAIRTLNGNAPILVESSNAFESRVGDHLGTRHCSGPFQFQEEKKEDIEFILSKANMEGSELNEAFEVQEDEAIAICGGPTLSKVGATGGSGKAFAAARRPPKPPVASRTNKSALVPPPPPRTPPPKLRNVRREKGTSTPTTRASATAPSTPDSSSISSSSATLPRNNTGTHPKSSGSHLDVDTTETESKTSTGSKASGSSFSAGMLSLKPQLISHLHHQASQTESGGRKKNDKFRLQRRVSNPQNTAAEILVPQETALNQVTLPSNEAVADAKLTAETTDIPLAVDSKDYHVREDPAPSIWTELWTDDGDETTKYTFDDDSGTFDTRQTATTYDQSQWGRAEQIMAMIPWAKIDSIVDRTKIDALIDKIPIGTLTRLAAFASPAEFDEETYDNGSILQESAIETDEGSFTTYRRNGTFDDDDDTFLERHSSLFKAAGCWIPTVPASLRRTESLVKRSSRFEPNFDLPDHFSAVAAADEASTIDGASIAAASVSERKIVPTNQLAKNKAQLTDSSPPTDLDSLAASSVPAEVVGSMFKRRKAPFTKQLEPLESNGDDLKTQAEKLDELTLHPVQTPSAENKQSLVVTPQRTPRSEPSSPFVNPSKVSDMAPHSTEASPVAVSAFPPALPESTHIASITDLFRRKDKADDESLIDAPSQPAIYVVVDDGASLGDLTMTTHELLVETAAVLRPSEPSHERLGGSGERQGNDRAGILSFFTCGGTDGLCSATSVPPTWNRAGHASSSRVQPPRGIQSQTALKALDEEDTYNESLYSTSPAVPVEMRAAAEAAWAKRTAEVKRGRPTRRKVEGYEI